MRFQSRQVHSGHDLLPLTAAGEVSWAAAVIVHRFRRPDWTLRPGQSKRTFPDLTKNRLSTKTPRQHHRLPWGHVEHRLIWWSNLECLHNQQWSKAGLCSGPTLLGIFFSMLRLCRLLGGCVHSDEGRRQTVQHCQALRQKPRPLKCSYASCCLRMMLPWHLTARQAFNAWLISSCLQGVLTYYQSTEDKHPCSTCTDTSRHTIDNTELEVVDSFTYLDSTVSSKASLDVEISSRIAKAAGVMAKLNKTVWNNDLFSKRTKLQVCHSCVLSKLLYGGESWPTYTRQKKWFNVFHLRCLRRLLQIRVPNSEVLGRADMPRICTLLIQRRLRWLGHVHRMEPGRVLVKASLLRGTARGCTTRGPTTPSPQGCLPARLATR